MSSNKISRLLGLQEDLIQLPDAMQPENPWARVEAWIAKATTIIRNDWPDSLEDFEKVSKKPIPPSTQVSYRDSRRNEVERQRQWGILNSATDRKKQNILKFLDGLLAIAPQSKDDSAVNSESEGELEGEDADVFISHISDYKNIANYLKTTVEHSFNNEVNVFVSSDNRSQITGDLWKQKIYGAIKSCKAFIVLVDKKSLGRLWVNFETGGAWILKKPILVICLPTMEKGKLPPPYLDINATKIDETDFAHDLMTSLEKWLNSELPPKFNPGQIRNELEGILSQIDFEEEDNEQGVGLEGVQEGKVTIPDKAFKLLLFLALLQDNEEEGVTVSELAEIIEESISRSQYFLNLLVKYDLINYKVMGASIVGSKTIYIITGKGLSYLYDIEF